MLGTINVDRRPYDTTRVDCGQKFTDDRGGEYFTVRGETIRKWSTFTRFMVRLFPSWPWGRQAAVEAVREDRLEVRGDAAIVPVPTKSC